MANCMFAYPDRTLASTVTTPGTSWNAALPLTNLKNRLKSKVARSTGVTTAHTTFDITLPALQSIRMLAILNHNASTAATVTLKFSALALGGSELGAAANLPFWAPFYPMETPLEWMDENYWDGTLCDADAADYKPSPDFWYVLPQVVSAKYVRVEITDTTNPAGYFQLGRCFVANGFQPAINLEYGATVAWVQDVLQDKSLGGVDWITALSSGREITGSLGNLSIAEGMVHVFDRQRRLGVEGELYFIFDPDDTLLLYKQRAMLCRYDNADPLQFPFFDVTTAAFTLKEVR